MFNSELINILSEKETACRHLLKSADEVFRNNERVPSGEQCLLLEKAAELEDEMAQLTTGAEKDYHIKRKKK